jgi:hypothetical protein
MMLYFLLYNHIQILYITVFSLPHAHEVGLRQGVTPLSPLNLILTKREVKHAARLYN